MEMGWKGSHGRKGKGRSVATNNLEAIALIIYEHFISFTGLKITAGQRTTASKKLALLHPIVSYASPLDWTH